MISNLFLKLLLLLVQNTTDKAVEDGPMVFEHVRLWITKKRTYFYIFTIKNMTILDHYQ